MVVKLPDYVAVSLYTKPCDMRHLRALINQRIVGLLLLVAACSTFAGPGPLG